MNAAPRWAVFGVGLLLVLALWERFPKLGVPLAIVLMMGLVLLNPQAASRLGFKGGRT